MDKVPHKPQLGGDLISFLTELMANNNKEWFETHRARYQGAYVEPTLGLIAALSVPLAKLAPPLAAVPKVNGSLRRINRDVRFSKDKRPYAPMLHLMFWAGDRPNHGPSIHLVVHPDRFGFGGGHWAFEPDQLERYRKAVITRDGAKALAAALARADVAGCVPDAPHLARVPRGFTAEEPVATMLRRKGMVVRSPDMPIPDELFAPKAVDFCLARIKPLMPLIAWLDRSVYAGR
jgi:uncharacterized protein (TIGR02453 family)